MIKCVKLIKTHDSSLKDLMHIRCGAHVINLSMDSLLKTLEPHITKIRDIAKKIHCASSRRVAFKEMCEGNKEPAIVPSLDVATRWNSTHNMLASCLRVKHSFTRISSEFAREFDSIEEMTSSDWEKITLIIDFREPFNQCKYILKYIIYLILEYYFSF